MRDRGTRCKSSHTALDTVPLGDCLRGSNLAEYLRRMCALCFTAYAEHAIFALYGVGRNGKGSFIRVIQRHARQFMR